MSVKAKESRTTRMRDDIMTLNSFIRLRIKLCYQYRWEVTDKQRRDILKYFSMLRGPVNRAGK